MCYQALKTSVLGPLDEKSEGQKETAPRSAHLYYHPSPVLTCPRLSPHEAKGPPRHAAGPRESE
jgi:hypothetical protein